MARGAAIGLGLLVACSSEVTAPWPELAGARSLIWAGAQAGQTRFEVMSLEPLPTAFLPNFAFEADRAGALLAFTYGEPLAELGLTPGLLENDPGGTPFPSLLLRQIADFDGQVLGPWRGAQELPDGVTEPRRPRLDGCARFRIEKLELDLGRPTLAVSYGEGVLLAGVDGVAHLDAQATFTERGPAPDLGLRAGAVADDGQLWVSSNEALYQVELQPLRLRRVATSTTSFYGFDWLVVGTSDPLEAYLLDRQGALVRPEGDRLQAVAQFANTADERGGLARLGPDDVVAVAHSVSAVNRFAEGRSFQVAPAMLVPGFDAVLYDQGRAVLAAQNTGNLYTYDGRTFGTLPGTGIGGVRGLIPWDGRYLARTLSGQLIDYQPDRTCSDAAERNFSDLYAGARLGPGLILGGLDPSGGFSWYHLTPR
jgi:hypothetical protein